MWYCLSFCSGSSSAPGSIPFRDEGDRKGPLPASLRLHRATIFFRRYRLPQSWSQSIPTLRRVQAQVFISEARGDATAWGARDKAQLQQVGFVNVFDGFGVFAGAGGQRVQADGAAIEFLDDGQQQVAVGLVEADMIEFQRFQGCLRYLSCDDAVCAHLGIVAHALEQAVD